MTYPSGHDGSIKSFLVLTPRIILWYRGSIVPKLLPQLFLSIAVSGLAVYLDMIGQNPMDGLDDKGFTTLGFLLSLLIVFKTQFAFTQFWSALEDVDGLLQDSRSLAMTACAIFDWKAAPLVQVRSRRIVRFLVLHFFVIVEFFQRTGQNATRDPKVQDELRRDIRALAGNAEFSMLYPEEGEGIEGSASRYSHTNPTMIVYWIYLAAGRIMADGGCPPPIMAAFISQLNSLMGHYWGMQKIDKTQFPLPYAQVVKIVVVMFIYLFPFFLVGGMRFMTPVISVLLTIGFFGLDEVAEILESPFGNDPNDIDLGAYGHALMDDLEVIYHSRGMQLDSVFTDDQDLNFVRLSRVRTSKRLEELGFGNVAGQRDTVFRAWCGARAPLIRVTRASVHSRVAPDSARETDVDSLCSSCGSSTKETAATDFSTAKIPGCPEVVDITSDSVSPRALRPAS